MKLQFDANQSFQLQAIDAVVDLFAGQPRAASDFTPIHVGSFGSLFAGQEQTELGVGNAAEYQQAVKEFDELRAILPKFAQMP